MTKQDKLLTPHDKNVIRHFATAYCIRVTLAKQLWIASNGSYSAAIERLIAMKKIGMVNFTNR